MNLGSNWVNNANLRELDERKRGWGKTKSDKTHCKKKIPDHQVTTLL